MEIFSLFSTRPAHLDPKAAFASFAAELTLLISFIFLAFAASLCGPVLPVFFLLSNCALVAIKTLFQLFISWQRQRFRSFVPELHRNHTQRRIKERRPKVDKAGDKATAEQRAKRPERSAQIE